MKYDIKYPARKYKSQGVEKTFWTTHGNLWIDDETKKMSIQLDSVPVGQEFTGKLWIFEQKPNAPKNQFGDGASLVDDDIQF
jgi:hypothetical protein